MDPYKMVFVNIVASLLLGIGVSFYRFVFPKKKINLFILLILISVLPIISILRPGDYESGDFNISIYRIISFYSSLKEGILMPSWAGDLNATYGNPLFIFNYPLPYYIISFFHFIGISFINGTKLYLGLVLYFSGIFMYAFIKNLTKSNIAAFTAAVFYIFNPYHLIDIHFRATLGESLIFLIVPLLFLSIIKYVNDERKIFLVSVALFSGLLFMAHPVLAFIFIGVTILYIYFFAKNLFKKICLYISIFIGMITTIYTWLPFIIYSSFMFKLSEIPNKDMNFYPFSELFFSPWRYGLLFQGPKGELAQIIGYTQLLVVVFIVCFFILGKIPKKLKKENLFWISLFFLTLFSMNPLSSFFWSFIPNVSAMINPFARTSLALSLFTSILSAYLILTPPFKKRPIFISILIIFTIGYTILNWGHRRVLPGINDSVLEKNVPFSTIDEGTTAYFLNNRWADVNKFWFSKIPPQHLEIIKGRGKIYEIKRNSVDHYYYVTAQTPLTIQENTLYYPGWRLESNSREISIYPGRRGIITANLQAG
ncbi:MAG: hypothetical protein M1576_02875, partial [Deltaproteobacteria bacterium]|nr:hypothetical protein [Deltaproteobacteria bacterium]